MQAKRDSRAEDLATKQAELDEIIAETRAEEEILNGISGQMAESIDDRLLNAYLRIRGGAKNGMAVVPIERDASAGSFIKIPPQRILDVGARKRIIVDEHSGRILVDEDLAREESEKMEKEVKKKLSKAKA
jgi:predicted  nucleic acid-binding Zn-ribbon protein